MTKIIGILFLIFTGLLLGSMENMNRASYEMLSILLVALSFFILGVILVTDDAETRTK